MKQFVHNQLEAETLIREAFQSGDEDRFDGARFYTHDGEFLFKCHIKSDGSIDMLFADGTTYNKEMS